MLKTESYEKVEVKSQEEFRNWLLQNHNQDQGVWLVTYKKSEGTKYVSREEVLDELLSFGWIDGIRRKLDDRKTMQLISPRRVQHWSKTYKERAKKLVENNRMHKSGLDSIEEGKKSGLWNFLDDVDNLIIPHDLEGRLKDVDAAYEFFDNINDSSKRFVLRWIKLAKTEKTRNNRIDKIVNLSAKGEKLPGS